MSLSKVVNEMPEEVSVPNGENFTSEVFASLDQSVGQRDAEFDTIQEAPAVLTPTRLQVTEGAETPRPPTRCSDQSHDQLAEGPPTEDYHARRLRHRRTTICARNSIIIPGIDAESSDVERDNASGDGHDNNSSCPSFSHHPASAQPANASRAETGQGTYGDNQDGPVSSAPAQGLLQGNKEKSGVRRFGRRLQFYALRGAGEVATLFDKSLDSVKRGLRKVKGRFQRKN